MTDDRVFNVLTAFASLTEDQILAQAEKAAANLRNGDPFVNERTGDVCLTLNYADALALAEGFSLASDSEVAVRLESARARIESLEEQLKTEIAARQAAEKPGEATVAKIRDLVASLPGVGR